MDHLRALLAALRLPSGLGLISAGLLLVATYSAVLAWAINTLTYSVWGGLLVVPFVIAVDVGLIVRAVRRSDEPWLRWLLPLALLAKLFAVTARYVVAYVVYNGVADAERYNQYAADHYQLWRQGAFVWEWKGRFGTQMLEVINTAVYTITGPTPFGAFVVFGSLAFWGVYLIYRAVVTALPHVDHRRYALLIFFLPSLLYWPASIGKEAWLMLFVGVTALGAARFFHGGPSWLPLLAVGAVGVALVRPHVAVLLFASLAAAQLFRPVAKRGLGAIAKVGGLLILGAAAVVLATQSAELLGIDDLTGQAVTDELATAAGQTQQGGSSFQPVPLSNPAGVPMALVTLLFRPFPWEGGNFQMAAQGMEGLVLLVLFLVSFPRWSHVWHTVWRQPFLLWCLSYALGFILAFSQFGNFGIVARQRVLMLPFVLVLLALPALPALRRAEAAAAASKGVVRAVALR